MEMKVGLLWYDDDPDQTFAQKMDAAVRRYQDKFGARPTTCCVNPASLPQGNGDLQQVKIVATSMILPHHFWLGLAKPEG